MRVVTSCHVPEPAFRAHLADPLPSPDGQRLAFLLILGCGDSTGPSASATHPAGTIASTLSMTGRPHGVAIASNGRFCVSQIDAASITCGMLTATSATVQSTAMVT